MLVRVLHCQESFDSSLVPELIPESLIDVSSLGLHIFTATLTGVAVSGAVLLALIALLMLLVCVAHCSDRVLDKDEFFEDDDSFPELKLFLLAAVVFHWM